MSTWTSTDYRGKEVTPLDEHGLRLALDHLVWLGVEAIAVCFLFSCLDDRHERRAVEIIELNYPRLFVSASSRSFRNGSSTNGRQPRLPKCILGRLGARRRDSRLMSSKGRTVRYGCPRTGVSRLTAPAALSLMQPAQAAVRMASAPRTSRAPDTDLPRRVTSYGTVPGRRHPTRAVQASTPRSQDPRCVAAVLW